MIEAHESGGLPEHLGMSVVDGGENWIELAMPIAEKHYRPSCWSRCIFGRHSVRECLQRGAPRKGCRVCNA